MRERPVRVFNGRRSIFMTILATIAGLGHNGS
jgi:hypothetical protein